MAEAWDEGGAVVKRIKQRIDERIREECEAIVADEDDVCDRHKINATDMANGLKRFYNDNCGIGGDDSSRGGEKKLAAKPAGISYKDTYVTSKLRLRILSN